MKKMILMAVAVIMGTLAGCDTSTNDIESSNSATAGVLTGKLLTGVGTSVSTAASVGAKVCMNGVCGNVSGDGSYSVNVGVASSVVKHAGRVTADTLLGTAYIVIGNDTMKEIPVTSWNLPTGYIVQRDFRAYTGQKFTGDSAQLVYWSNDSIAYVVGVEIDDGNSTLQYTGSVYTYYDSAAYVNDSKIFSYFVRTYHNGVSLAYSDIYSVKARSGGFSTDSTRFHLTTYNRTGYSLVPALDTVKKWINNTTLGYNRQWINPDSAYHVVKVYDTAKQLTGWKSIDTSAIGYSSRWDSIFGITDSIKVTYRLIRPSGYGAQIAMTICLGSNDYGRDVPLDVNNSSYDTNIIRERVFGRHEFGISNCYDATPLSVAYVRLGCATPNTVRLADVHIYFHVKN